MLYVEFLIDGEPYELELHPGMVFTKCAKCGQKIYGYCDIDAEIETLCDECNPPPDPKKKLIEYLNKHMGITFIEEEVDAFFEKGDTESFLEEIHRRRKASHRGKGRRSSVTNRKEDHHPSVKIIPATK